MKFLLKVNIPVEEGNQTIINGTLPKIMEKAIADLKPEKSSVLRFREQSKDSLFLCEYE